MAIGYAYVDGNGFPYPDTVASSERAAMVNALVSTFGQMVYASDSDAAIRARFVSVRHLGADVRPVEILPVTVETGA